MQGPVIRHQGYLPSVFNQGMMEGGLPRGFLSLEATSKQASKRQGPSLSPFPSIPSPVPDMQRRIPSGVLSTNPPRCSGHIRNTKYQAGQGLLKGRQNNSITKNVEMSVLRLRFTYVGRYLLFSPLLSLPIQSNPIRTCMNE